MSDPRTARFHRQLILPEVGLAGQQALARAKVLVVGCGGLGAPVIQYLAAAGVGALTLVDDDTVEMSNLNRQIIHRQLDVGRLKVERAAEWVKELDPQLNVVMRNERLATKNMREAIAGHDLVIDCADGLPVKYLINDAAVLERVALVHGAVTAFGGQVMTVPAGGGPCLRCIFPEIPNADEVPSCQTAGVLGAVCGVIGTIMALEALKLLVAMDASGLIGRFLAFDGLALEARVLAVPARRDCAVCGDAPVLDARHDEAYSPTCT